MSAISGLVRVILTVLSSTLVIAPSRSLPDASSTERAEAAGHRIALGALVGPAGEVEDHVVGVERVAVGPGDARRTWKHVFGGVVVHIPALEQVGLEGELRGVLDQRLERLALGVRDLRPVGRARILGILDRHRDLQHAALLGLLRQRLASARRGRACRRPSRSKRRTRLPWRGIRDGRPSPALALSAILRM